MTSSETPSHSYSPSSQLSQYNNDLITILDLPTEVLDIILEDLPIKALLSVIQVSRILELIVSYHLKRRLHNALARQSKDVWLRVNWSTPVKNDHAEIGWEYIDMATLSRRHNNLKINVNRKPEFSRTEDQFLIFKPGGPESDPRYSQGRTGEFKEDKLPCYHASIPGCRQASEIFYRSHGELILLDWFENFVQFRLRLSLTDAGLRWWICRNFVERTIRIPRDWLNLWSESNSNVDNPDDKITTGPFIWFDDETAIGLQLYVVRNSELGERIKREWAVDEVYEVALHRLWIPMYKFLLEEEAAVQRFTEVNKQIVAYAT